MREPTLSQVLHLAVGDTLRDRVGGNGKVKQILESKSTPEEIIGELFIGTLCRHPTHDEAVALRKLVGDAVKYHSVYEDIFWSLLNSTEFAFNH